MSGEGIAKQKGTADYFISAWADWSYHLTSFVTVRRYVRGPEG